MYALGASSFVEFCIHHIQRRRFNHRNCSQLKKKENVAARRHFCRFFAKIINIFLKIITMKIRKCLFRSLAIKLRFEQVREYGTTFNELARYRFWSVFVAWPRVCTRTAHRIYPIFDSSSCFSHSHQPFTVSLLLFCCCCCCDLLYVICLSAASPPLDIRLSTWFSSAIFHVSIRCTVVTVATPPPPIFSPLLYMHRWMVLRTNSWGYLRNGTFDGMIGALVRKEIDVGGSPIFFRLERAKVIDYTARTWIAR